ncbi:hypothetical protein ACX64O_28755 (plasmid) [Pseudomonas fitomaticsae]
MTAKWKYIGVAKWYDCKLGTMYDSELARLANVPVGRIQRRRELFGLPPFSINQAIERFAHLIGFESDQSIARKCGASVPSVRAYRQAQGIAPRSKVPSRQQRLPAGHPLRPFKDALRLVSAEDVATAAGVPVQMVLDVCAAFGIKPPQHEPPALVEPLQDVPGPWLGYESLLSTMPSARISQAVGVPLAVVDQRRAFLGVQYQRTSKAERFAHLFGLLPNATIAKLAGVSTARIADMRKSRAGR